MQTEQSYADQLQAPKNLSANLHGKRGEKDWKAFLGIVCALRGNNAREHTSSSIEVEEAACRKLNVLLTLAMEIERNLLNLQRLTLGM